MQSLTHHARARMQQRGIRPEANPGAAREAGRLRRTYAILGSDGIVITVGHRYRRVTRA
jgi:hypothetical protein